MEEEEDMTPPPTTNGLTADVGAAMVDHINSTADGNAALFAQLEHAHDVAVGLVPHNDAIYSAAPQDMVRRAGLAV